MPLPANQRRARLRLIRRQHRKMQGLPLRRDFGRRAPERRYGDDEERDLDTPDPDRVGLTEDAL